MSITMRTDDLKQTTYIASSGILTLDNIKQAIGDFYRQKPTLHAIWDMSDVTRLDLTFEQVRAIANKMQELRASRKGGRTALVSPADAAYGLSRMLEILIESSPRDSEVSMKVFRDLDAAYQWLEQPA